MSHGQNGWRLLSYCRSFLSEMCTQHCKAIGPPPKAITWDHTRQSSKLGVNQASTARCTLVHIQNGPGKTDEGNSTCGALFPAVIMAFGIQLVRSLSLSLSLARSLSLSVALSLSLSVAFSLSLSLSVAFSLCRFVAKFLLAMSHVGGVI